MTSAANHIATYLLPSTTSVVSRSQNSAQWLPAPTTAPLCPNQKKQSEQLSVRYFNAHSIVNKLIML